MTPSEALSDANRIVVGVDGSEASRYALEWATRQAKLTSAPLIVVTAWHMPNDFGLGYTGFESIDFESVAQEHLSKAIAEVVGDKSGVEVVEQLLEGHPAVVLAEVAKGAALVVVGSQGHGEFAGMLLGSVSEFLSTHAPCTVVVVRKPKD